MWPFKCKTCPELQERKDFWFDKYCALSRDFYVLKEIACTQWTPIAEGYPPLNKNLLVANKDFTYFGFLYLTDGWDNTKRITLYTKDEAHLTYTHPDHIAYWLNIDAFKKDQYEPQPPQFPSTL